MATGDWTFWLPSSAEEGRALAQPASGWCDRSLWKPPIERFVSQTCVFDTKRSIDAFQIIPQTTPVPLRGTSPPDLRRYLRFQVKR
jgi:hypothetical protein